MIFGLLANMDHAEENEIKVAVINSCLKEKKKLIIRGHFNMYICFKCSTQKWCNEITIQKIIISLSNNLYSTWKELKVIVYHKLTSLYWKYLKDNNSGWDKK